MRSSDFGPQTSSVRLSRDYGARTRHLFWSPLSLVLSRLESRPAFLFIIFSFAFGSAISVVVPPLRGPDEVAHFLRIHSYARGELLPAIEVDGRKGILIEPGLHARLGFFKNAGERFAKDREQGLRYGEILQDYPTPDGTSDDAGEKQPWKFMPFAGTEGYNPVAYAPYVLAADIGNMLELDFPNLLLLMRVLGLIAFTAVVAYAIRITPTLKWAFVLIAMLPVSIYNRSVLSADGAALACALMITAQCFSAIQRCGRVWERSLWMTLCTLSKQPQIVLVLLELMACRATELRRRWSSVAFVVLPSLILSPLWVWAVSAEIAAWRLLEAETHPPEHFDPLWKLAYMWEHPLHFPLAAWTAVTVWGDRLWPLQRLSLDGRVRARVAAITGLAVLAYVFTVYLIFFVTYTPVDIDHVRGVQGRYFVVALPMAAIFLAALTNVDLPRGVVATAALAGSLLSGVTSFQALLEAHWSVP